MRTTGAVRGMVAGLTLLGAWGCTSSVQKPYVFETRAQPEPASIVARALTADGQVASEERPGEVRTSWVRTGVRYGYAGGRPAEIVRRFLVNVLPEEEKLTVQIRTEMLACSEVAILSGEYRLGDDCGQVHDVRPEEQREMERVGKIVERAFAAD